VGSHALPPPLLAFLPSGFHALVNSLPPELPPAPLTPLAGAARSGSQLQQRR
jgi:hypothetical protein